MKFSIYQKPFLTLVSAAAKGCGGLEETSKHVKLIATGGPAVMGEIKCVGTNLETMIVARDSGMGKIEEPGEVLLPAKLIVEILTVLGGADDELISVATDGTMLTLRGPRTKHRLTILNADAFPPIPALENEQENSLFPSFEIKFDDLIRLFERTSIAAAAANGQGALAGVALWIDDKTLFAAATDSKRAAMFGIPLHDLPVSELAQIIIPIKTVNEVVKIANRRVKTAAIEKTMKIFSTKTQVGFETLGVTVFSRLLDAKFPNITRVFPVAASHKVVFSADAMLEAIRVVKAMASAASNMMTFTFSLTSCVVTANAFEQGSSETSFPLEHAVLSCNPFAIAFNYKFVEAVLNVLLHSDVCFRAVSNSYPGEFGVDSEAKQALDHRYRHVIMPMNF